MQNTQNMQNTHIIVALGILSLIFIIIGHKYRDSIQLQLQQPLIVIPETILDWWSVSHFLLFMVFGLLEPGHHGKFFILGVLFEIIEDMLSADHSTQLADCTKPENKHHFIIGNIFCNGLNDDYWYGKWDDIFVNALGYTLGSSLRTL
jgi:hypothetical protein